MSEGRNSAGSTFFKTNIKSCQDVAACEQIPAPSTDSQRVWHTMRTGESGSGDQARPQAPKRLRPDHPGEARVAQISDLISEFRLDTDTSFSVSTAVDVLLTGSMGRGDISLRNVIRPGLTHRFMLGKKRNFFSMLRCSNPSGHGQSGGSIRLSRELFEVCRLLERDNAYSTEKMALERGRERYGSHPLDGQSIECESIHWL